MPEKAPSSDPRKGKKCAELRLLLLTRLSPWKKAWSGYAKQSTRYVLKTFALAAITFYQRALSPRRGFSCAFRVHAGSASCSALGFRAVRRYGVRRGFNVLRGRLKRRGDAWRQHRASSRFRESGHCDVPDVPCHHGDWDCAGSACGVASGFDVPCEGGGWGRGQDAKKGRDAAAATKQGKIDGGEPR